MARFLQIGMGSATELEYHLLLARDLGYLTDDGYTELQARTVEVQRMLAALIRRVQKGPGPATLISQSGGRHMRAVRPNQGHRSRVEAESLG